MVPILHQGCNIRRRRGDTPRRSHHRQGISGRGTHLRHPLLLVIRATSTMTILLLCHLGTIIISTMRTLAALHFSKAVWAFFVAVACSNNAAIAFELMASYIK
ncbi:uncharacterized protein [Primulina huaijiensis]|uniref:uncharacterized protein n=1 Tax=Primulina huaijiensis TaxID=1492673 RepID=UPI003CC6DFE6